MKETLNAVSLDRLCASLCGIMDIPAPAQAAPALPELTAYAAEKLGGLPADRVLMYNPDAIAEWIDDKYPEYLTEAHNGTEFCVEYRTVMPSVTPVCFGTMYTGAQPEVHGIRKYEKPVIRIDTLFDALLRAGKKPVIVAEEKCSLSRIFLERQMDYFILPTVAEVNAKAAELICEDRYDFIVVYNGNYDATMHKNGPEGVKSLAALHANSQAFGTLLNLVKNRWTRHNTFVSFAMDHGCHEIDNDCGSHGLDMPEDLNIRHRYIALPAAKN